VSEFLFVYGTLQTGFSNPAAARLREESRLVGPAVARGRMYDVSRSHLTGRYPGFIPDEEGGPVHGELLEVSQPARTFLWLDPYEGFEYRRDVVPVRDEAGRRIDSWCYTFVDSVDGLAMIRSGRWGYQAGAA
jgi:gamma-glutamylcyclotransferase (GGCT)/AIG2-like uncharacterized protein YtfP